MVALNFGSQRGVSIPDELKHQLCCSVSVYRLVLTSNLRSYPSMYSVSPPKV